MTVKTCTVFVLLKNDVPVNLYQTEWFKYSRSFSMNRRDMFTFMCGLCTGLGDEYTFNTYNPNHHSTVSTIEV
jgi:hypothetical protein